MINRKTLTPGYQRFFLIFYLFLLAACVKCVDTDASIEDGNSSKDAQIEWGSKKNCVTKGPYVISDIWKQYSTIITSTGFLSVLKSSFSDTMVQDFEKRGASSWHSKFYPWKIKNGERCSLMGTVSHPYQATSVMILRFDVCDEYLYGFVYPAGVKCSDGNCTASCKLICGVQNGIPTISLSCGTGSMSCQKEYNGLGQVKKLACTYSNGRKFTCNIHYDTGGKPFGGCTGEGETCTF